MMATVPHVTSGSGLRKFQADGFLLDGVYHQCRVLANICSLCCIYFVNVFIFLCWYLLLRLYSSKPMVCEPIVARIGLPQYDKPCALSHTCSHMITEERPYSLNNSIHGGNHAFHIPQHSENPRILHTLYTGCPRRNGQNFGRVFLMLKYTDITQNTYVQISLFHRAFFNSIMYKTPTHALE